MKPTEVAQEMAAEAAKMTLTTNAEGAAEAVTYALKMQADPASLTPLGGRIKQ